MNENDNDIDGRDDPDIIILPDSFIKSEEPPLSEEELALLLSKRKKRQRILVLIAAIAWVCVIMTFLYINGYGPFRRGDEESAQPIVEAPAEPGEVKSLGWATAGQDYEELFKLISEQTSGFVSGMGDSGSTEGIDAGLPPLSMGSEDFAPSSDTSVDSATGPAAGGGDEKEGSKPASGPAMRKADAIKADEEYIYAINSNNLFIIKIDKGGMELVSKISQEEEGEGQAYFEMYVYGDRLIAIRQGYNLLALRQNTAGRSIPETCIEYPVSGYIVDTTVDIFDISDRRAPVKIHTLTQSGEYSNSRMVGGCLYLVSSYYGDVMQMAANDPRTFVPLYARDGEQIMPDESDIFLPPGTTWPCFIMLSGIDVADSGDFVSHKSVYGASGAFYMSPGAVYFAYTIQEGLEERQDAQGEPGSGYIKISNWSETVLTKFVIDSGRVEPDAQSRTPGYILNQSSFDEHEGILRLITINDRYIHYEFIEDRQYTDEETAKLPPDEYETTNELYILGEKLEQVGYIGDIAPGEHVYSCNFFGDVAYFMTIENTSPVVSVDMSDPAGPRVVRDTNVRDFSEYLYSYSNGRLFGLGGETDPETNIRRGLRLAMYEDGAPADLGELHSLMAGSEYAAIGYNLKAIFVDAERELVVFPAYNKYFIYSYNDTDGFSNAAEIELSEGNVWGGIRGLFVGEVFYVVEPNVVDSYAIDSEAFSRIDTLIIDEGAGAVNRWGYTAPGMGNMPDIDDMPEGDLGEIPPFE